MSTDKHRASVTMDDELVKTVEKIKNELGLKKESKTLLYLIKLGIETHKKNK